MIFLQLTVIADHFELLGECIIITKYSSCIAVSSQIFGRIKRSAADMPHGAAFGAFAIAEGIICADGLGVVFNHK